MNFRDWLQAHGITNPILDGQVHKVPVEGDRGKETSGWYIGTAKLQTNGKEYATCTFENFRTGVRETFPGKNGTPWTNDERRFYEAEWKRQKEVSDKEKAARYEEGSKRAREILQTAQLEASNHPYVLHKKIKPYGVRCTSDQKLIIPLCNEKGEVCGTQAILADGTKRFSPGTKKLGAFFKIPGSNPDFIAICEGFATAATVHEATGFDTYVAFDCGNLYPVTEAVGRLNPSRKIVIFGDDDRKTESNPGRTKAVECEAIAGVAGCVFPSGITGTDWNDAAIERGLDAVKKEITDALHGLPVRENGVAPVGLPSGGHEKEGQGCSKELTFQDVGKRGAPKATIENLKTLLDHLGIIVRYNVISKEEEILIPNETFTIDNRANASLAHITSWCNRVGIPTGSLGEFLSKIADSNPYNPVATWIESVPWDKESRLKDLYDTIQSPTILKEQLIKKWLISCVAAVYEPEGVSAHGVLVFRGNQYIGKTKWFKNLAPSELGVLKDGAILRPEDKDSVYQCISKWLVELGELDATFRKSDIAQLKGFLTKNTDELRRPYSRKENKYARRTVFFASVNEQCFLNDPTGNRRFWTIECESINYDHGIDMQQLWAEVKELYVAGEEYRLNKNELDRLNESNESFQGVDPIEEKIRVSFRWNIEEFTTPPKLLTATEVCELIGIKNPSNNDARKAGHALRKLIKEKPKTVHGLTRFLIPPLKKEIEHGGF